ncbi:hypothetical protein [Paenibacillus xylanexedens]|uniref:hypothetical protein n=1 Tax=Paenibacillus xylanexedens TaxID=528191 RepID=UPI000F5237C1|nr:hypothetical protein [Paenibacillus xylanexedens]
MSKHSDLNQLLKIISDRLESKIKKDCLDEFNRSIAIFGWEFSEDQYDAYILAMMELEEI